MSIGVQTMFDFNLSEKMQQPYVIITISTIIGDVTLHQNGSKVGYFQDMCQTKSGGEHTENESKTKYCED